MACEPSGLERLTEHTKFTADELRAVVEQIPATPNQRLEYVRVVGAESIDEAIKKTRAAKARATTDSLVPDSLEKEQRLNIQGKVHERNTLVSIRYNPQDCKYKVDWRYVS